MFDNKIEREKNVVIIIALIIGAMFITAVVLVLSQAMLSQYMNQLCNVVCVSIATICGFVLFPVVLLRKAYAVSPQALGICKPVLYDWLMVATAIATVTGVWIVSQKQPYWLLLLIVQNLVVAGSEEFLCRSALTFILERTIKSRLLVGIISIVIFVFVIHSNATVVENLIWRLPISVLLVCIYMKRKSIYIPYVIHFTYNIIVSII